MISSGDPTSQDEAAPAPPAAGAGPRQRVRTHPPTLPTSRRGLPHLHPALHLFSSTRPPPPRHPPTPPPQPSTPGPRRPAPPSPLPCPFCFTRRSSAPCQPPSFSRAARQASSDVSLTTTVIRSPYSSSRGAFRSQVALSFFS